MMRVPIIVISGLPNLRGEARLSAIAERYG